MNIAEILRNFGEIVGNSASVRSVYGEPVRMGDRVVLPVAKIRYAFGGGGGEGGGDAEKSRHEAAVEAAERWWPSQRAWWT